LLTPSRYHVYISHFVGSQVTSPHEKTRLVACRTSAAQYVNGRNSVHHYLLPVSPAADGGAPTAVYVSAAAATTSSVSLGSRCQPSTTVLRRLHRMAASEGNDDPEPRVPLSPPPVSTTMPSRPPRPHSIATRPVLERQLTTTSPTTTVNGANKRRLITNSRQPSFQSMNECSSTLDALGLRRSAVIYLVASRLIRLLR